MFVEVQQWLNQVQGLDKTRAIEDGVEPISDAEILRLAEICEWARFSDDSDLNGVYPVGLLLGWGDMLEYCRSGGKLKSSKVFFVHAIPRETEQRGGLDDNS